MTDDVLRFEDREALAHYVLDRVITPDMTFEERLQAAIYVGAWASDASN